MTGALLVLVLVMLPLAVIVSYHEPTRPRPFDYEIDCEEGEL